MTEHIPANITGPANGVLVLPATRPDIPASAAAPANAPVPPRRTKLQTAVIVASLCAAVFVAALDVTIITTALPAITEFFRSPTGYQWVGSGYVLPHTASVPLWGKLSDIWGRKLAILAGALLFIAGSLVCALASSFALFLFGRAVQGLGAAGLITLVNICISDLFSLRDRGLYFGLVSIVWALASGVGPVLGGVFTDRLTWRWCFWINLPIGSVVSVLIFFFLSLDTAKTSVREGLRAIDWAGTLLVSGGVLMVLLGLDFGGHMHPWHSAVVICLLIFGIVCGALFVVYEAKWAKFPLIPIQMFTTRSSAAAFTLCFCHGYVFIGIAYYLPLYLQAVLASTALRSGLYLLPYILSVSISAAFTGAFIQWTGKYMPSVYSGGVLLCVGAGLLVSLGPEPEWAKIIGYQIVAGTGVGFNFEGPLLAVQAVMGVDHVATVTATMGFVRTMSTAVSIVIGGVVFQNRMVDRFSSLEASLDPRLAAELAGPEILAKLDVIAQLPSSQQRVVRNTISNSLRDMWIMYTAFAGLSLIAGLFIKAYHLKTELEAKSTHEMLAKKAVLGQQPQPQLQQQQRRRQQEQEERTSAL
ncbi:MFS general substrate transporter [Colletotrichum eremochloae]|nr:MFS general substrate transporter [Colletotrichum eremochloae]